MRYHNISIFRLAATLSLIFFHIIYIGWPMETGHWSLLRMSMLALTTISGFLIGRSSVKLNSKAYYASRAKRLLLPALYCFTFMLIWCGIYYAFHPISLSFVDFFCGQRAINGEKMFIAGNYYYLLFYAVCVIITPLLKKGGKARWGITIAVIIYEIVQSFFLTIAMDSFIMVLPYVIGFWIGEKDRFRFTDPSSIFPWTWLVILLLIAGIGGCMYVASHSWIQGTGYWLDNTRGFIRSFGILFMTIGGLFSFLLLLRPFNALRKSAFLDFSDCNAYFVFLMDQCFVVGGTSVLWFTQNKVLQVILVYVFAIVSSLFLCATYTRFFSKKTIRMADIAPGYRFLGYWTRWLVPFVSKRFYRPLYLLRKLFISLWAHKDIKRETFYVEREDGTKMKIRVYTPKNAKSESMTAVVYFHGGGYGMGSVDDGRSYIEAFLENDDCVVFSVDYRLSFQAPYPAALEDGMAAIEYVYAHHDDFAINPRQIFVAGESAGGGLASSLCLYCREKGRARIACQIALYPMLDDRDTETSAHHDGPIWNHRSNIEAWTAYLGDIKQGEVPECAAPSRAKDYSFLPPLISYVGTMDAFYAEDMAFYEGLARDGVEVSYRVYPGCFHCFDTIKRSHPLSRDAFAFLQERFHYAQQNYFLPSLEGESNEHGS